MVKPRKIERSIASTFAAFPGPVRQKLLDIRDLIFMTAQETAGVGRIEEALRWGQPSYLTAETGSGSTIRLGIVPGLPDHCAVFFHCQSGLVEQFKTLYGGELSFSGHRAIVIGPGEPIPIIPLRHCLGLALTHHLRKRGLPRSQK